MANAWHLQYFSVGGSSCHGAFCNEFAIKMVHPYLEQKNTKEGMDGVLSSGKAAMKKTVGIRHPN